MTIPEQAWPSYGFVIMAAMFVATHTLLMVATVVWLSNKFNNPLPVLLLIPFALFVIAVTASLVSQFEGVEAKWVTRQSLDARETPPPPPIVKR